MVMPLQPRSVSMCLKQAKGPAEIDSQGYENNHSLSGYRNGFFGNFTGRRFACNKTEPRPETKNVGDLFGGGIIFYRVAYSNWMNGEAEYYIYSIAATSDQSQSAPWGCSGIYITADAGNDRNWEKQMTCAIAEKTWRREDH